MLYDDARKRTSDKSLPDGEYNNNSKCSTAYDSLRIAYENIPQEHFSRQYQVYIQGHFGQHVQQSLPTCTPYDKKKSTCMNAEVLM